MDEKRKKKVSSNYFYIFKSGKQVRRYAHCRLTLTHLQASSNGTWITSSAPRYALEMTGVAI